MGNCVPSHSAEPAYGPSVYRPSLSGNQRTGVQPRNIYERPNGQPGVTSQRVLPPDIDASSFNSSSSETNLPPPISQLQLNQLRRWSLFGVPPSRLHPVLRRSYGLDGSNRQTSSSENGDEPWNRPTTPPTEGQMRTRDWFLEGLGIPRESLRLRTTERPAETPPPPTYDELFAPNQVEPQHVIHSQNSCTSSHSSEEEVPYYRASVVKYHPEETPEVLKSSARLPSLNDALDILRYYKILWISITEPNEIINFVIFTGGQPGLLNENGEPAGPELRRQALGWDGRFAWDST